MKQTCMLLAAGLSSAAVSWAQTPQQVRTAVQDLQYFQQVQALDAGSRGGGVRITPVPPGELGKPFSATITTHTSQSYVDGTNVNSTTTVVQYRDAEGRTRIESDTPNDKTITIRDPVARTVYILDSATKVAIQRPMAGIPVPVGTLLPASGGAANPLPGGRGGRGARGGSMTASGADAVMENAKRNPNNTVDDLGTMTVNGVPARGTRITTVIPVGAIGNDREFRSIDERWYSPDLNMLVKSVSTDPRFGTTTHEMTNISRVNPDRSMFEVPADYKIVSNQ
ncbi:MAG: hypothetical protein WBY44_29885 [Bryobacteraceae bacterium]